MSGSDWTHVLAGLGVLAAALAAGGQIFVLLVVLPEMRSWPASRSLQTHGALLHRRPDRYLTLCTGASLGAAVALLALHSQLPATSTGLIILGVLSTIGVLAVSVGGTLPTSGLIESLSPDAAPVGYAQLQARWDRLHALRTLLGTAAVIFYLMAALTR